MADKSRMIREVHVRFCEGLGVKFPWAIRLKSLKTKSRSTIYCIRLTYFDWGKSVESHTI